MNVFQVLRNLLLVLFLLILITLTGCGLFEKKKGCTDIKALNHDFSAEKEDGSCMYSKAIFYASFFSPFPPVTVTVDGSTVGTITAAYPTGPGNCSVPGVATYQFQEGNQVDWIATDQAGFIFSGVLSPKSSQDCILVKVF